MALFFMALPVICFGYAVMKTLPVPFIFCYSALFLSFWFLRRVVIT
jgi:hypothetical protein